MAPKHQADTILVIGAGPRKAAGTEQYAHGVVDACSVFAESGHAVVLLDNSPYLALPDNGPHIQRRIEPLTQAMVAHIAEESGARRVYAEAGGDGAQRLAMLAEDLKALGSGPAITALALDRSRLFAKLTELGLPVPAHAIVETAQAAVDAAQGMDFPLQVTVRPTAGSGSAAGTTALMYNQSDLQEWIEQQLDIHPGASLLVERAALGWQRYEVIVLRDEAGQLAIAGLQAYIEPTGTATTDAGWVQPPVNADAQMLEALTATSRSLLENSDLKGVASLTLAMEPTTGQGVVLDLTLGTSRNIAFSAAASGLPLFRIAAKMALGSSLAEVWPEEGRMEASSGTVAVRLPVAPQATPPSTDGQQATVPPSLGDVMGLGENVGTAFSNALESCEAEAAAGEKISLNGDMPASPWRYLQVRAAIDDGMSAEILAEKTGISGWFADALSDWSLENPTDQRAGTDSAPFVQTRDEGAFRWEPLAAAPKDTPIKGQRRILIIAGRPNTIGQSRELDLAACQAVTACKQLGCEVVVLGCDPLSAVNASNKGTRVCLGPADLATVSAIHSHWPLDGVMLQCAPGHLLPLAEALASAGIPVLGPSTRALTLLDSPMALHERLTELGIPHPQRALATDAERAQEQAEAIGYPLLLNPVTAQGNTSLIMNAEMLQAQIQSAAAVDTPYLMEEFIEFAIELTADAICDGVDASIPQAVEHIELAGIHPGDSAWVIPPYSTSLRHVDTISEYLHKIAVELKIKGPLSGRFAVFNDTVYLLAVDLAFTRTAAMVSDACNLPLFAAATRAMLGESLAEIRLPKERPRGFSVREAVFPIAHEARLASRLGPVMQSTGEVIGRAETFGGAYYKSQEAAGDTLPTSGSVLITVTDSDKPSIIEPARLYRELGFNLMATRGTAAFLSANGIPTDTVRKLGMGRPDLVDAIKTRQVDLVINTPSGHQGQMDDGYIRKAAIQYNIPYISTPAGAQAAAKGIAAQRRQAKI